MRAEDLDNLTEKELQQKANACFIVAEDTNINLKGGETERLRLHLEAQFYLTAVARKRDEQVAARDLLLEKVVIWLISVEIVLSLGFGGCGLWEGYKQGEVLDRQAKVLEHMDKSAAETAKAMGEAKTALQILADEQKASLESLKLTNDTLRDSLKQNRAMTSATEIQLGIFQREETEKLAQLSKRPKLFLFWGDDVGIKSRPDYDFTPLAETDTSATFHFTLHNSGNATASRLRIDIGVTGDRGNASLDISPPLKPTVTSKSYAALDFDFLRPGRAIAILLTITFPKGQSPFYLSFNADADEIDQTYLGQITVHPRTPVGP